ncbi:MAG TPA: hypothetical protein VK789_16510 [Bryobacteraceae bacterium]|nr:hypothetical protein [Bryobacteraceae bacterium]
MSIQGRISSAVVLIAMAGAVCTAQTVTSAHSGTLHYFEGDVAIDGNQVQSKFGKFEEIKPQSVLSTKLGRAEVLLTPGVFLRMGENSSVRMIDNRLVSTRVDVLSGNVIVESDDPQMDVKDSPVVLLYKDYEIRTVKHGLAELNSDLGQFKVFKGEALVEAAGDAGIHNRVTVKESHMVPFSAALVTEKFDEKTGDDLYIWARDRSQVLSAANMSSAQTLSSGSGYGGYGYGSGLGYGSGYGLGTGAGYGGPGAWNGGWYFNPFFGMYTYVPGAGTLWNPWGFGFFSPYSIYNYYTPTSYWYGGGGPAGGSAGGRPVFGLASSTTKAAPIGSLLNSTGRVGLGSPLRSGTSIGVPARTSSMSSVASSGAAGAAVRGGGSGGGFAAATGQSSGGGFAAAGGHSSGGGSGGGHAGGGGGGHR